ncbi:MAG TPA: hypothetical protein VHC40_07360 [Rhizomicrobium sp.]|nr:hypothetical protein [Rhizomicrobium sp.]
MGFRIPAKGMLAGVFAGAALLLAAAVGWHVLRHPAPGARLEMQARRFVTLAMSLGRIRPREIDAYFGPPELEPRGPAPTLAAVRDDLARLRADLAGDPASTRRDHLRARVDHLIMLVDVIRTPHLLDFDEEARRLYGVAIPAVDTRAQQKVRAALEALLPGPGSLAARVEAFRNRFLVPESRQRALFMRALAECRARTLAHWQMPKNERLDIEWTGDTPWHRYRGGGRSLLLLGGDAVAEPGTALDVACHEAYPGHHAQFTMMPAGAGRQGVVVEDTVVILRSPEQVMREGAANYGVDLAFPPWDRLVFMRDVLFPLAGFDPRDAETYVQVHRLLGELSPSAVPILRDYYDRSRLNADAAAIALARDALISSPEALLHFTDALGAYVTGYTVARDLVRKCVETRSRATDVDRWAVLRQVVADTDVSVLDPATCLR